MAKELIKEDITELDLRAGSEYLKSLRKLGFEPDLLCWVQEIVSDFDEATVIWEKRIAIVSTLVDRVGPLAIYELLFEAYDASATPKEIDPFSVSIYSPLSMQGRLLSDMTTPEIVEGALKGAAETGKEGAIVPGGFMLPDGSIAFSRNIIIARAVYTVSMMKFSPSQDLARFERFKKQVENLAA